MDSFDFILIIMVTFIVGFCYGRISFLFMLFHDIHDLENLKNGGEDKNVSKNSKPET